MRRDRCFLQYEPIYLYSGEQGGKDAGFAGAHQTAKVVVTVLDGAQTRWKGSLEDTNGTCVLTGTVSFQKALCLHGNIWKGSSEPSKGWLHR